MKKTIIIFSIIFILIGLFLFSLNRFLNIRQDEYKDAMRIMEEYPMVENIAISGIVTNLGFSFNRYCKGLFLIDLNSGGMSLYGTTRNHSYPISDITSFIEVGDSISKSSTSDTIFIYQNKKAFFLFLEK